MYQIQEASELELAYATLMKETMNHNKKLLHRLHQMEAEQEENEFHAQEDACKIKDLQDQVVKWRKRAEQAEKDLATCQEELASSEKELASCQEELSNVVWERDELVEADWERHRIASAKKNNNANDKIKINEDDDWDQICDKLFPIVSLNELVE
jgi:chromosome segregation ATPase